MLRKHVLQIINKIMHYPRITLTLPTYLLRLAPLHPAQPGAYPTLGHVESNPGHSVRQTARRYDGEAIGDRRSRHQTGRAPYRGQLRPVGQLLLFARRAAAGEENYEQRQNAEHCHHKIKYVERVFPELLPDAS